MGDGLKRAFAAAARARATEPPSAEMLDFLRVLAAFKQIETRKAIGPVTSKAEQKARDACRRLGYAKMGRRADGKWGWRITAAGRRVVGPASTPSSAEGA